jgi:uncharacterized coiled-coil protein SlyX
LEALAHVSKGRSKKDDVREFLAEYVNHPKKSIQRSALTALGHLEDPKAISVLEAFADVSDTTISRAAKQSLERLRNTKPVVPKELVELRGQMAEMKKTSEKLQADLKALREQLKAKDQAAEEEDKASQ